MVEHITNSGAGPPPDTRRVNAPPTFGSLGNGRFDLLKKVGEGGMGIVYEAWDRTTAARVALKTLKSVGPTPISQLKWEFRSLSQLAHANLIQLFELIATPQGWFFTMEMLDDCSDFISHVRGQRDAQGKRDPRRPLDATVLRGLFHQLCLGVQCIHQAQQLHRDIKPSNALITGAGRVVLVDFGLSTALEPLRTRAFLPKKLQETSFGAVIGTIGYMAPEQAAGLRVGPPSDCYAIGAMLFEALTGRLPFVGKAQSVLVSKQSFDALAPADISPGVPPDLNMLCRRLLQRQPGARPAIDELVTFFASAAPGRVPTPGTAPPRATTPVFVGRDHELSLLRRCLQQVRDGQGAICHVLGASGAGKTTLVEQFLRGALADGVRVFSGKCYENESVPFKAIDDLIDSIAKYLFTLSGGELETILPEGMSALARMFPVLLRLKPLERLAGMAHGTDDPLRSRDLACEALCLLLRTLARTTTIILAIDDLQWSDPESSALLAYLVGHKERLPILLVFIYRKDHAVRNANLQALMDLVPRSPTAMARSAILVGTLAQNETFTLARSLLDEGVADKDELARRFSEESGGSALFVAELVRHATLAGRRPNQGAISLASVIWERIRALGGSEQALLEVICIAGGPIRLADLRSAVPAGGDFFRALNQLRMHRLIRLDGLQLDDYAEPFHDRYRETLLERLPADEVKQRHGLLAQALVANQPDDHDALAEHFRRAGVRDQARSHSLSAAQQAIGNLAFAHAENLLVQALELSEGDHESTDATERLIHFYTDLSRFDDAYAVARRGVQRLGQALPASFGLLRFVCDWYSLETRLYFKSYERLLTLPVATSVRATLSIKLMNAVAKAAFQINPRLCIWVSVRIIALCQRHGNTPDCAIGYMVFGAIFKGGHLRRYRAGYQFGRLALDLVERYANAAQRAEVHFVVGYFGTMWTRPVAQTQRLWQEAYDSGLSGGDRFHTGCAAAGTIMSMYFQGAPFARIQERLQAFESTLTQLRLGEPLDILAMLRQAMHCLQGATRGPDALGDAAWDEQALIARLPGYKLRHFAHLYFIIKLQLLLLSGNREALPGMIAASAIHAVESIGMPQQSEHTFYTALAGCAVLHQSATPSRSLARTVASAHRAFITWSSSCPENFRARERLIAGECARIQRDALLAEACYREGILAAAGYEQVQLVALGRMLYGRLLDDSGRPDEALAQRRDAAQAFGRWGATAVAQRLCPEGVPQPS